MTSNITFFDTGNTVFDLIDGVKQNFGDGFGLMILFISFFIIYIMFQNYDMKQIILFEGFALSLISIMMVLLGWLSMAYVVIPAIILGFGIFFNIRRG